VDVELVGRNLFGRRLRLRVLLWVLSADETFFLKEAADEIGYSASGVRDEFERLVDLGMLLRNPPLAGDRRTYYSRTDSPLWDIIEATRLALLPQRDSARRDHGDAH
jgi:hypothetical protein